MVGLSCYLGYRIGAIRVLASVGGIVAAVYFAPQWAPSVEPVLNDWLSLSGLFNRATSLGLVGLGIVVVSMLLGNLAGRLLLSKENEGSADGLNRWSGLLLMGSEAVVGIALLLGGILTIFPKQEALPAFENSEQNLNYQIDVIAAETRSGVIGRVLEKHNPFVKFPQLNKFKEIQQTFRTISNPAAMKQVITHPRITKLQNNPSIQTAITNLKSDKVIKDIIDSGEPLDSKKLMALLNSQDVIDLLDQPEFIDETSKIIEELNLSD